MSELNHKTVLLMMSCSCNTLILRGKQETVVRRYTKPSTYGLAKESPFRAATHDVHLWRSVCSVWGKRTPYTIKNKKLSSNFLCDFWRHIAHTRSIKILTKIHCVENVWSGCCRCRSSGFGWMFPWGLIFLSEFWYEPSHASKYWRVVKILTTHQNISNRFDESIFWFNVFFLQKNISHTRSKIPSKFWCQFFLENSDSLLIVHGSL